MDDYDARAAAMERINNGAEVSPVDAALIESWWEAISSFPRERPGHAAVGLSAIAGDHPAPPLGPDEMVALLTRCALLNALAERGLLRDLLSDASLKKKLFAGMASIRFTKYDLVEALAADIYLKAPAEEVQKLRAEMAAAGLNPDSPRILERLVAAVRERS